MFKTGQKHHFLEEIFSQERSCGEIMMKAAAAVLR
jgi:hypothetical protein